MQPTRMRTAVSDPYLRRRRIIVRAVKRSYASLGYDADIITSRTELSPGVLRLNLLEWDTFRIDVIRRIFVDMGLRRPIPRLARRRFPRTVDALQDWVEEVYLGMSSR